jgi:hemoglobin
VDFAMNTALPFENRAKESGLTAQLVQHVVIRFYDQIRRDAVLGPIFEDAIGEHWDEHIERIVQFWLTATRLGRGYDGRNFMPRHLMRRSIRAEHLPRWLGLFRETATEQCSPEGASALIDIAERMAETLEIGLARRDRKNL